MSHANETTSTLGHCARINLAHADSYLCPVVVANLDYEADTWTAGVIKAIPIATNHQTAPVTHWADEALTREGWARTGLWGTSHGYLYAAVERSA